jgi:hypothetical protein
MCRRLTPKWRIVNAIIPETPLFGVVVHAEINIEPIFQTQDYFSKLFLTRKVAHISYLERRVLAWYRRIVVFDFKRPMVREILQVGWRSNVQPTVHPRDGRLKQFYVDNFCTVQYWQEHQLDSSGERNTEPPDGHQNEVT